MKSLQVLALLFSLMPTVQAQVERLLHGQVQSPMDGIASPNASSFHQIGNIPVNLYTGRPNIAIDLYEVTSGNFKMPLSMSYDASGFRPDVHPGWVGLNWSLSAGGVITRKVNDMLDENEYVNEDIPGFFLGHSVLDRPDWDAGYFIKSHALAAVSTDTAPDEFMFDFLGYSGSFFMDEFGNWVTKSDLNLKVEFLGNWIEAPFDAPQGGNDSYYLNGNKWFKTFGGFAISTPDGTKFIFGNTPDAIEFSIPFFNTKVMPWRANSWYLTKIILPNGREVNLTYNRISDDYSGKFVATFYERVYYHSAKGRAVDGGGIDPCSEWNFIIPTEGIHDGDLIAPVYLEKIETDREIITFVKSKTKELKYEPTPIRDVWYDCCNTQRDVFFLPYLELNRSESNDYRDDEKIKLIMARLTWYQLDKIIISSKSRGSELRRFDFTYNNPETERLSLYSIQEFGENSSKKPPYIFQYDNSVGYPGYLSRQTDHWGFFDGSTAEPILNIYYNRREPAEAYLFQGAIKKITYPTGGSVTFAFEGHKYRKSISEDRSLLKTETSNKLAGGLRIKSIIISDEENPSKNIIRNFYYVTGYTPTADISSLPSSGVLGGAAQYEWTGLRTLTADPNVIIYRTIFSNTSVIPAANNAMGSHVGYSQVVEKLGDNSYRLFKYTNFDTGPQYKDEWGVNNIQEGPYTPYEPYTSREFYRGSLLSTEVFSSSQKLLKSTSFAYAPVKDKFVKLVFARKDKYTLLCDGQSPYIMSGNACKEYLTRNLPSKETTKEYSSTTTNSVATVTDYEYDDYLNLTAIQKNGSDGRIYRTEYKYSYHFKDVVIDYSTCEQFAGPCRTECQATTSDRDELAACYDDCATQYADCRQNIYDQSYFNNVYYQMTMNNQVSEVVETRQYLVINGVKSLLSAELKTFARFNGNRFAVDKVYEYRPRVPQSVDLTQTIYTTSLKFDQKYTLLNQFEYDADMNIKSMAKLNDVTKSYIWDYAGQRPVAEVVNAIPADVAYIGFETQSSGNFSGVLPSNVLATDFLAGRKSYNLAGSTITKPVTANKKYRVSYWSKNGALTIAGSLSVISGASLNGFTFFVHEVSRSTGPVTITGNAIIDELRICPVESLISTFTYDPDYGMTSSQGSSDLLKFFEYNEFGQLKTIRDEERNVVRDIITHNKN